MTATPRRFAAMTDAVARLVRRRRRSLAAVAAFVAVFGGLNAVRTPPPQTVAVFAAVRDLPGGTTLRPADLTVVRLPPDAVPAGSAAEASALVGRTTNAPVSARTVITETTVSSGTTLAAPGNVVLAIPLGTDALSSLVQPGVRVDLIAPGTKTALVTGARVVGAPAQQAAGFAASSQKAILVEVPAGDAPRVAQAASSGALSIALR